MRANRLVEPERPLIFGAAAHAFKLATECLKLIPAGLLVADRAVSVRRVLKMAAEIFNVTLYQAGNKAIVDAGCVSRGDDGSNSGPRRAMTPEFT